VAARRPFGRSGLEVSPLRLGGNVFGWTVDADTSIAVLDAYVEAGGNAVDTANTYSGWVPGNRGGESEEIIGRWLAGRADRDEIVIATKVGREGGVHPRGLSRDHVLRGAEGSLRRLGVERIDLYYAHADDPTTPLAETLAAFAELIDQGLVRAIGASNYSAERLAEALAVSAEEGLPRFEGLQTEYNLLDRREYEGGLEELCAREGLGVAAYFALARGFLSGKYRPGAPIPATPRAGSVVRSYLNDRGLAVLAAVDAVGEARGATAAQVALAWVMARPSVSCAVASATSVAQVRELAGAMDLVLSPQEIARLDAASAGGGA
jgi:aryl-alcohol dehydrogenase-like predicted oxidoreductase